MKRSYLSLIAGSCLMFMAGVSQAATANFDGFAEGSIGASFTEDGITFSDFDNYLSFFTPPFTIVDGSSILGNSTFSPNNVLSFMSGAVGYGRFGSMTMSVNSVVNTASIDIFASSFSQNNKLTLSAYYQGSFVDSTSVWLSDFEHYTRPGGNTESHQYTMTIGGIQFDELRLVSSGPYDSGVSFILVDNVVITSAVPIPPAGILLVSGLMWLGAKRKMSASSV